MEKFERGKRAELGIYDDCFLIDGDIEQEFIVPHPSLLHDKATAERHKMFMDALNSLGCTSFTLTSKQITSLLNNEEDE